MEDAVQKFLGSNKYAKWGEDDTITGKYIGSYLEEDPFKKGEQRMVYKLDVEGTEKLLSSKSKRLAGQFIKAGVSIGDNIKISRFGEGFETNYKINIIK